MPEVLRLGQGEPERGRVAGAGRGGAGGETGGPAAALVGRVCRILGTASMALVTMPFSAEGMNRRAAAGRALDFLAKKVDGVVAFSHDELPTLAPPGVRGPGTD